MSAFDPKRTSTSSLKVVHFEQTRRPDRLTLSVEPKEIPALIGSGDGELATKRLNHQCRRMPTTSDKIAAHAFHYSHSVVEWMMPT